MAYLKNNITKEMHDKLYAGHEYQSKGPHRHRFSKWFIPMSEYPYSKYPPYIVGNFCLMTPKSLQIFYQASKVIKPFIFDDVYLGIIAFVMEIKPVSMNEHVHDFGPVFYDPDYFASQVIGSHGYWGLPISDLLRIWKGLDTRVEYQSQPDFVY